MLMKTIAIIPARYASSRFPGKVLADIGGKSMIQRVYEQVSEAALINEVLVATDDDRIFHHVRGFGGRVAMTRPDHRSGTDRCAEIAAGLTGVDMVINVQGDEPFIDPVQVDGVVGPLLAGKASISTLARPLRRQQDLFDPNVVKAVFSDSGRALYFSRSPVPFLRNTPEAKWVESALHFQHIGLYGFQYRTLLEITRLPPSRYEQAELLEQLRWLEAGYAIHVNITDRETLGVDTPEDLERARAFLQTLG